MQRCNDRLNKRDLKLCGFQLIFVRPKPNQLLTTLDWKHIVVAGPIARTFCSFQRHGADKTTKDQWQRKLNVVNRPVQLFQKINLECNEQFHKNINFARSELYSNCFNERTSFIKRTKVLESSGGFLNRGCNVGVFSVLVHATLPFFSLSISELFHYTLSIYTDAKFLSYSGRVREYQEQFCFWVMTGLTLASFLS